MGFGISLRDNYFRVLDPNKSCVVAYSVVGWILDDVDRWLIGSVRHGHKHDGGTKRTD